MSRDAIIINSYGVQGKIVKRSEEVRDFPNLTDEQKKEEFQKVPDYLKHCTKIDGIMPTNQPVVTSVDYDMDKGIKYITTVKEKHIFDTPDKKGASKKYKETVMTEERFPENISQHELKCMEKDELMNRIQKEVDEVDLDTIKGKEDILKFANGNGYISNTEKKRRAVLLLKQLDPVLKERFEQEKKEYKEKKAIIWTNESGKGKSELLNEINKMSIPYYERPRITSLEIANL
jgi:hypothetical protein